MSVRAQQLHLLVILDALLSEGSVTGAARRLSLTQPAVSQALARARRLFDDPLLVRADGRMVATARASALAADIESWMVATRAILEPDSFDPATHRREFVICCNDFVELALLPPLVGEMSRAAPNVTLALRSVESTPISSRDARDGRVHLTLLGIDPPSGPFKQEKLYEEHFVLLARHGHPALAPGLTPDEFTTFPQALVSPQGIGTRGPIDDVLAGLGLTRRVALSVTRFASLPSLLADSDLIAAVPSRFAGRRETAALCGSAPLPFTSPRFAMRMAWHLRYESDPGHQWLRTMVQRYVG